MRACREARFVLRGYKPYSRLIDSRIPRVRPLSPTGSLSMCRMYSRHCSPSANCLIHRSLLSLDRGQYHQSGPLCCPLSSWQTATADRRTPSKGRWRIATWALIHLEPRYISLSKNRASNRGLRRNLSMLRLSLYVLGLSAFVATWAVYQDQQKKKPIPVKKAAAMLQEAWADHHTSGLDSARCHLIFASS